MAFLNRISGVLKQTVSKNMNMEFSASNTSLYQAIRSMSSSKLFVGGISWSTDEMSLKEAFSQHGEVLEARIITDRDTGRSRGFGFVTFTSSDEANSAIQAFDGQELHGRQIRVNFATEKPRGEGFGGGGGYGGGGGGYGGGGGGYGGGGGGYAGGNYGGGGGYGGNTGGYGGNTGGYGGTTPSSYGGSGGGGYGTSGVAPPAGGGDYYNSGVAPPAGGGDFYNSGVAPPPAGGGDFYNSGVAPPAGGGDYYNSGNTGYAGTTTQATFDEGQRGPTSSNVADEFNDDTVEGNDRDENDGPGDDYANTRA